MRKYIGVLCECALELARYFLGPMLTLSAKSHAVQTATSPLAPLSIRRREPGPTDVEIDICIAAFATRIF